MYSNKVYILFVLLILITFVIYTINQHSEEIKKQNLVHSEEETIDTSITDRNDMPDEPGITLDTRKEEVKELKFHSYYSDGMVLQRDTQNNIWGYSVSAHVSAKFSCQ